MYCVYRNEIQHSRQFCICNFNNPTARYTCDDAHRSRRLMFLVTTELPAHFSIHFLSFEKVCSRYFFLLAVIQIICIFLPRTECPFCRVSDHGDCHGMSQWIQAFYTMKLFCALPLSGDCTVCRDIGSARKRHKMAVPSCT
jgi:hypothetical protein